MTGRPLPVGTGERVPVRLTPRGQAALDLLVMLAGVGVYWLALWAIFGR